MMKEASSFATAIASLFMSLVCASCATTFRGAAEDPFPKHMLSGGIPGLAISNGEIAELLDSTSRADRDRYITRFIAIIDLGYGEFCDNLTANRKHSDAGIETLNLIMDIAGTLTPSAAVKNNYLAASALLSGGKSIFDKDYLFNKTLEALVAQMDAMRASKLLDIKNSMMQQDIFRYDGASALADIHAYYRSGNLGQAIRSIQTTAATSTAESIQKIRTDNIPTTAQIALWQSESTILYDYVYSLDDRSVSFLASALSKDARIGAGVDAGKESILIAVRQLHLEFYSGHANELLEWLMSAAAGK